MAFRSIFESATSPVVSFELFPPKTPAGLRTLYRHVERLMAFRPGFVTCTYGAGGSTQEKTLEIVSQVKQRWQVPVAAHLTCVGANRQALADFLADADAQRIDAIVALRGDPPQGSTTFETVPGGLSHANELVELIRADFPRFGVAVAGYPEKHVEAPSMEVDLEHLKRKVDAGADVVITQLFYENSDFLRFRDACRRIGIGVPIVPGLLPIASFSQIQRITSLCGAKLPQSLVERLQQAKTEADQASIGTEHAIAQVEGLLDADVPGIHFYVLNRSEAASQILRCVEIPTAE